MTHIVIPNWLIYLFVVLITINLVLTIASLVLRHRELELERQDAQEPVCARSGHLVIEDTP